jgi:hypothetical protein
MHNARFEKGFRGHKLRVWKPLFSGESNSRRRGGLIILTIRFRRALPRRLLLSFLVAEPAIVVGGYHGREGGGQPSDTILSIVDIGKQAPVGSKNTNTALM